MAYKLFVQTSARIARIVPGSSQPTVADRMFGEISTEDALSNRESLAEAVRDMLAVQGITDGDTYTIVLPDDLRIPEHSTDVEDSKGPLAPHEVDHQNPVTTDTDLVSDDEKAKREAEAKAKAAAQSADAKTGEKAPEKTVETKTVEPKQEVKDETTKS